MEKTQQNLAEMEKSKKDLLVLGLLEALRYCVDTTARGSKRKKQCFRYAYQGEEVCSGFNASKPSVVSISKAVGDQPQDVTVLTTSKEAVRSAGMPVVLPFSGLSDAWKKYLFMQVRPHVADAFKDKLCPKPAVATVDDSTDQ